MSLPSGNYTFNDNALGYSSLMPSGTFMISNRNITLNISFISDKNYTITFKDYGLPSGFQWNVTLNGLTESNTSPSISFNEVAGNYSYVVDGPSGYNPTPDSGVISVDIK